MAIPASNITSCCHRVARDENDGARPLKLRGSLFAHERKHRQEGEGQHSSQ